MTNATIDTEDDKPLDPAMERVRRKMVRLLFVSSSAIVLALMAVLGTIVYKANRNSKSTAESAVISLPQPPAKQSIILPRGFVNDGTTVDGNRVWFSGTDASGKRIMIVHDIGTGKTLTEISVDTAQ